VYDREVKQKLNEVVQWSMPEQMTIHDVTDSLLQLGYLSYLNNTESAAIKLQEQIKCQKLLESFWVYLNPYENETV